MSWVLVIQPDSLQADALRAAFSAHVSEDIIIAESIDDALSSIDERIPDVILLPPLTAGAVEDYLIAYVGTIPGAGHVQILGLPLLEQSDDAVGRRAEQSDNAVQRRGRWLLPWKRPAQHDVVT